MQRIFDTGYRMLRIDQRLLQVEPALPTFAQRPGDLNCVCAIVQDFRLDVERCQTMHQISGYQLALTVRLFLGHHRLVKMEARLLSLLLRLRYSSPDLIKLLCRLLDLGSQLLVLLRKSHSLLQPTGNRLGLGIDLGGEISKHLFDRAPHGQVRET